jgi:phosphohistidine phosphatase SixA
MIGDVTHALAALLLAVLVAGGCGTAAEPDPLVVALQDGEHVLFLRHTATDAGMDTTSDPADCGRQRNLSSQGRDDAEAIGEAVRALDIPFGDVRASPLCRTMDTARLAFGDVVADERLLQSADPDEVRALLDDPPAGGNRVLVGHQATLLEAAGVDLDEGETAVFSAGGALISTLTVGDWQELARRR